MITTALCGCETETSPSGLALSCQTCEWCNTLRLANVKGTLLAVKAGDGREAREAGVVVRGFYSKLQ